MRDYSFYTARLPRALKDKIEARALQIYDAENVEPYTHVRVSKAECIRRAVAIIAPPRTRRPNQK